jgi:hypothetical protein
VNESDLLAANKKLREAAAIPGKDAHYRPISAHSGSTQAAMRYFDAAMH